MRILITVAPRLYREVIALSIHRLRPGHEVRVAPPEAAERELAGFQPHLLVHNDTDGVSAGTLASVLCRVEVLYSDGMGTRISLDGKVSEARDMSTEDLLRVVDLASSLANGEAVTG